MSFYRPLGKMLFSWSMISLIALGVVQASELDLVIKELTRNRESCQWLKVTGKKNVVRHPSYAQVKLLAERLDSKIEWTFDVAKRVRRLPFHPARMPVELSDEMFGWFDEYTNPALIILESETGMVTLLHELRHALQLGRRHDLEGGPIELAIWQARAFESLNRRDTVLAFIETASEISAHSDELKMAKRCGDKELHQTASDLRLEYWNEFKQHYKILRQDPALPRELKNLYLLMQQLIF